MPPGEANPLCVFTGLCVVYSSQASVWGAPVPRGPTIGGLRKPFPVQRHIGSAPRGSKPPLCIYRSLCCLFLAGKRVGGSCTSRPNHRGSPKTIPCSAAHRECPPGKQTRFAYLPVFVLFIPCRQACGGPLYLAAHPWGDTQI